MRCHLSAAPSHRSSNGPPTVSSDKQQAHRASGQFLRLVFRPPTPEGGDGPQASPIKRPCALMGPVIEGLATHGRAEAVTLSISSSTVADRSRVIALG